MTFSQNIASRRLGLCYYPDINHYRQSDLEVWLPRLRSLAIRWLLLQAPEKYAIPEAFLVGLIAAGIEPVLQFNLSPIAAPPEPGLLLLFEAYARWGVRSLALFDRPNLRLRWSAAAWAQPDLVERFLDRYLPLANAAMERGLSPIFPGLEPGGDYWDTVFLRLALQGMLRRCSETFLERMILGAYAWTYAKPLDWGIGGPEQWPQARPYLTTPQVQDQRGVRIFDWYQAILKAVLGEKRPILLLAVGHRADSPQQRSFLPLDIEQHTAQTLALTRLDLPSEILACNFWLLAAEPTSPYAAEAWFQPDGTTLPIVKELAQSLQQEGYRT